MLQILFCRLRMSGLPLRIQTGRYGKNRIPHELGHCLCCKKQDMEDEYHFVFICECYTDIRKKYLKPYYFRNPSVYKFIQLSNSNNKNELIRLSIFVKESLTIRNQLLTVEHN